MQQWKYIHQCTESNRYETESIAAIFSNIARRPATTFHQYAWHTEASSNFFVFRILNSVWKASNQVAIDICLRGIGFWFDFFGNTLKIISADLPLYLYHTLDNDITSETGFKPVFVIRRPILKTKRICNTIWNVCDLHCIDFEQNEINSKFKKRHNINTGMYKYLFVSNYQIISIYSIQISI